MAASDAGLAKFAPSGDNVHVWLPATRRKRLHKEEARRTAAFGAERSVTAAFA
jgi:hypothetical protein